jgi:hypothetical protein
MTLLVPGVSVSARQYIKCVVWIAKGVGIEGGATKNEYKFAILIQMYQCGYSDVLSDIYS